MNPVPRRQVTWSAGLWATACLPPCLPWCQDSFQSFIFLAPAKGGGECGGGGASHSMQISVTWQNIPHTEPVTRPERTVPMRLGQEAEKSGRHHHTTSVITADRYKPDSPPVPAGTRVNNTVSSWFVITKKTRYNIALKHFTWFKKKWKPATSSPATGNWSLGAMLVFKQQWNWY